MYAFRFCPDCGAALPPPPAPLDRLVVQVCVACGAEHFRNAKPCAGALVVDGGRVLLGRRAIEPGRGTWDIPGGFVNPWEHPAAAARREIQEETGLDIVLDDLLSIVIDTYHDRDYTLNVYYLAHIQAGVAQPADDLDELRWFATDELPLDELAFAHATTVLAEWQARAA